MSNNNIIEHAITNKVVYDYYLAEYGEHLGVYPDGTAFIDQSVGDEISPEDRPIATIKCPGFSNVDSSVFTEPLVYNEETDTYVDVDGRHLTIQDCVREAIDIDPDFRDEVIRLLTENRWR